MKLAVWQNIGTTHRCDYCGQRIAGESLVVHVTREERLYYCAEVCCVANERDEAECVAAFNRAVHGQVTA